MSDPVFFLALFCAGAGSIFNEPGGSVLDERIHPQTRLSSDVCRNDPIPIRAVKIRIEADEHQIKFFRNNILVGIIEIKLELRRHLLKSLHIFATQPENSDAAFSKEVLDEKREQV